MCRRSFSAVGMLAASFAVAHGQAVSAPSHREAPEPATAFGAVVGHVTLAGSNAPARLASVALQPVEIKPEEHIPGKPPTGSFAVYQTGLDGSYVMSRVSPGRYYLVVQLSGYLSPFDQFTRSELEHPSGPTQQRIDSSLPVLVVRPNATTTFDLQLQRGAGLGGTIRFDDGIPLPDTTVSVQRRDPEGNWVSPHASSSVRTGDDGRWHLSGLAAGEYRVRISLSLTERRQSSLLGENGYMSVRYPYSLTLYSGDTPRQRDAKSVTLSDGQDMSAVDLTVPVSRLHTVSGSVVDARTGQAVNEGKVELVYADDGKALTSTTIDYESRTFTFSFVPEGEYRLNIKDAREGRRETTGADTPFGFTTNASDVTVREYAPSELALLVGGTDRTSVTLPVDEKPSSSKAKPVKLTSSSSQ